MPNIGRPCAVLWQLSNRALATFRPTPVALNTAISERLNRNARTCLSPSSLPQRSTQVTTTLIPYTSSRRGSLLILLFKRYHSISSAQIATSDDLYPQSDWSQTASTSPKPVRRDLTNAFRRHNTNYYIPDILSFTLKGARSWFQQ